MAADIVVEAVSEGGEVVGALQMGDIHLYDPTKRSS